MYSGTRHVKTHHGRRHRVLAALSAVVFLSQVAGLPVLAAPVQQDLDLSSRTRNVRVEQSDIPAGTAIKVGRQERTVNPGDMLTAAEHLALEQVLATGQQTLVVGRRGAAVGGTFSLNGETMRAINEIVIPNRVTAIHDFASAPTLDFTGNLVNSGRLLAVSSSPAVCAATIGATNIFNQR